MFEKQDKCYAVHFKLGALLETLPVEFLQLAKCCRNMVAFLKNKNVFIFNN